MLKGQKIRMEEPVLRDFTDNRVGIFQPSQINAAVGKAHWQGVEDASLPGTATLAITFLLTLVTATDFREFFNIPGATWRAVFVISFICFSGGFLSLLIRRLTRRRLSQSFSSNKGSFFEDAPIGREDKDIAFNNNQSAVRLLQSHRTMDQKSNKQPFRGVRKK